MLWAKLAVAAVALIHVFLMYVEIFAWTTRGKGFLSGMDPATFEPSKILAKNVGVYNGFLAAGLVYALVFSDQHWSTNIAVGFLGFIAIAGLVGAWTADWKLALLQTAPALLALGAIYIRGFSSAPAA